MFHIADIKAKEKVIVGVVELPMGVTHLSVTHMPRQTYNQPIGVQGAAVRERGVKDVVVNITTVFAGDDINREPIQAPFSDLRSLIAQLRSVPFLPIYSDELMELVRGSFGDINIGGGSLNMMSVGLTVAVQSVRVSSIQGHPNAVQVDMSFALTNLTPVTGGLILFKDKSPDGVSNPQLFMYNSKKITDMIKDLRKNNTADFKLTKVNGRKIPSMTLTINAEDGIRQYERYINAAIEGNRLVSVINGLKDAMQTMGRELTRASEAITNDQYKRSLLKDVMTFSAYFTNTLVPITLTNSPIPTHQYLGSSPIQFQIGIATEDPQVVKTIVGLHELVLKMSKALWFFHGYLPLRVSSPITGLMGVHNISIIGIDFGSIDGNSNSYQIEINAVSNDATDYIEQLNQVGKVDLKKLMAMIAKMSYFDMSGKNNWLDVEQKDTSNGEILPSVEDSMKRISDMIRNDVRALVGEVAKKIALNDKSVMVNGKKIEISQDIIDRIKSSETKADISVFDAFANAIGGANKLAGLKAPTSNDTSNEQSTQYKCSDVIDGDTIIVSKNGKTSSIRFANIDAQEVLHDKGGSLTKPVGPYADAAKAYVQQMINNANGNVYIKSMGTGRFGRTVGEVYVKEPDGTVVNLNDELLKRGLAVPFMPNDPKKAYGYFEQAFNNKAGMFAEYNTAPTYTPDQLVGNTANLDGKMAHVVFTPNSVTKSGNFYVVSGNDFSLRVPADSTSLQQWLLQMKAGSGIPQDVYGQLVSYNDELTMVIYIKEQMQDVVSK